MEFEYIGYTSDRRVVKGRVTADNESAAGELLSRNGYQVLSLKVNYSIFNRNSFFYEAGLGRVKSLCSPRQLALLLESGVGIVQSLELLRVQTTNKGLASMLGTVVMILRAGLPLSASSGKASSGFNKMYCKIIAVGEQTGQLESVLRNLANYAEQAKQPPEKLSRQQLIL